MLLIPNAVFAEYVTYLNYKKIPESRFADYKKWLRYYLDYSDKYPLPHTPSERIRLFCACHFSRAFTHPVFTPIHPGTAL